MLTGEEKEYSDQPTYCLASVQSLAKILKRIRISGETCFPPSPFAGTLNTYVESDSANICTSLCDTTARWYKGDLHMHTTRSDGPDTPEQLNLRAGQNGLDYYVVTDHNYWHETWPLAGCMVIPGMEITMEAGHRNVFGHCLLYTSRCV